MPAQTPIALKRPNAKASRVAKARAIKGKYAHVRTSSAAFAARKEREIANEERAR